MLKSENVATPETAGTVLVPDSEPLPGFAPMATVMLPAKVVTVFPWASCAVTLTAGVMVAPAVVFKGGGTEKISFVAGAGMMSKAALVIVGRPELDAFSV